MADQSLRRAAAEILLHNATSEAVALDAGHGRMGKDAKSAHLSYTDEPEPHGTWTVRAAFSLNGAPTGDDVVVPLIWNDQRACFDSPDGRLPEEVLAEQLAHAARYAAGPSTPEERAEEVRRFFYRKAELVRSLHGDGYQQEAFLIATTALDALVEVWLSDFPEDERTLLAEFALVPGGGAPTPGVRLTRFLSLFAPVAPLARHVAVVPFAEDLERYAPHFKASAERLLAERLETRGPGPRHGVEFRTLPAAHKDAPIEAILEECPELARLPRQMIEEYTYPALLYAFVRNPLVHHSSMPVRRVMGPPSSVFRRVMGPPRFAG